VFHYPRRRFSILAALASRRAKAAEAKEKKTVNDLG